MKSQGNNFYLPGLPLAVLILVLLLGISSVAYALEGNQRIQFQDYSAAEKDSALVADQAPKSYMATHYTLGAGDRLEIVFYDRSSLDAAGKRFDVSIREDGTFYFPLLGKIVASGLSPAALEEKLTIDLDRFVETPIVRVHVLEYISNNATLLGAFFEQGVFPLPRETMLTDFIAANGGLLPEADVRQIWVIRENGDRILLNLENYYKNGDRSQDIPLVKGDRIYAPAKGEGFLVTLSRVAQIAVLVLQVITLTVVLGRD